MEKIRTAALVIAALACCGTLYLLIESHGSLRQATARLTDSKKAAASARNAVSYSCGYHNGQRSMMERMPSFFSELPDEMSFCPEHRENAASHGFMKGSK